MKDKSLFVSDDKIPVKIKSGDKEITLYANEVGFSEIAQISLKVRSGDSAGFAMLLAASITDEEGQKFTLDEARKLKRHAAEPLLAAALKVNGLEGAEKN